jgi:hypothetical protein
MIASWTRAAAIALLVLTTLVAVLIAAAWSALPLDRYALHLDGETISLAELNGTRALLVFVGCVAAVVLAIVAALMVIVGLGVGAVGVAIGLLVTAASVAMVVAPFVLVAWGVWRLVRGRPSPPPAEIAQP